MKRKRSCLNPETVKAGRLIKKRSEPESMAISEKEFLRLQAEGKFRTIRIPDRDSGLESVYVNQKGHILPENQKVKGARKIKAHGLVFDSHLEYDFYLLTGPERSLKSCIWKPDRLELVPSFTDSLGKKRKAITWAPDSYFPEAGFFVDPKGHITSPTRLRLKLHLHAGGEPVLLLRTKADCKNFIMLYRAGKWQDLFDLYSF